MKQTQKWWLMGAMLVIAAVLIIGIYFSGWLDVAQGDSDARGLVEVGSAIQSVAFSPDGTLLAAGAQDGVARVWRIDDGLELGQALVQATSMSTHGRETAYSHDVAFSPDGTALAFGLPDGTVRLWRVAFSPDGKTLASGSLDGTIQLWRVP